MKGGGAVFGWVPLVADGGTKYIFFRESERARFEKLESEWGYILNLHQGPNNNALSNIISSYITSVQQLIMLS